MKAAWRDPKQYKKSGTMFGVGNLQVITLGCFRLVRYLFNTILQNKLSLS